MTTYSINFQLTPSKKSRQAFMPPDFKMLERLRDLIEATFWWNRDTAYYADKLGLSINALTRLQLFTLTKQYTDCCKTVFTKRLSTSYNIHSIQ